MMQLAKLRYRKLQRTNNLISSSSTTKTRHGKNESGNPRDLTYVTTNSMVWTLLGSQFKQENYIKDL